jgi:hypothetical protein
MLEEEDREIRTFEEAVEHTLQVVGLWLRTEEVFVGPYFLG